MRLRGIELYGFKSFADRTKLTFDDGITAVVGPNGSGKSNISDAIKWVFGEQSSKSLRGTKMEDVIFGGTKNRNPLGCAWVSLFIDNTARSIDVDSDEVILTRKLYRSGESEYRVNNSPVRLRDIHEIFMDTGLGRDGYSIIEQGKIGDIVGAKSTQRREIFEEAAGISKYRYRKGEAERRLAQAEENLVRLRDIMGELENRVGPLKTQSEKAQQFLILSEEKKTLELSLWLERLGKAPPGAAKPGGQGPPLQKRPGRRPNPPGAAGGGDKQPLPADAGMRRLHGAQAPGDSGDGRGGLRRPGGDGGEGKRHGPQPGRYPGPGKAPFGQRPG